MVKLRVTRVTRSETADHHGSHRDLLWTPDDAFSRKARIDAIIVPTARTPAYLRDAVKLAAALDCPLVTLHSGKWTTAADAARQFRDAVDIIAIDLPDPGRLRLPDFATSRLLAGTRFARRSDTSAKRNLGLALSHMVGWKRIAFLDDDIIIREPDGLRLAAGLLDTHNVVGLYIGGYPDNSVVCHAYKAVGGEQASFIGSGALVVEAERSCSFFPDIYNDDWFYMLDADKGLQPVATVGEVIQRPYDPFRTTQRARDEELGDVLAEGNFWLLDQGRSVMDADAGHWKDFLAHRKRFIERVLGMVKAARDLPAGDQVRMVASLKASLGRLEHITPGLCQDYLRAWAADRKLWRTYVDHLATGQPRKAAVRALTQPGRVTPPGQAGPAWSPDPAPAALMAGPRMVRPRIADPQPSLT